jgi:starvation-inducible DNA-binding protein
MRFVRGSKMNLADSLKHLLANSYSFVIKAQQFHWNVEGPDFPQYHKFFGKIYSEVYASLDKTAEYIRTLDSYTPGSMERFIELSDIKGQTMIPRAELMFAELLADNEKIQYCLTDCMGHAKNENNYGIENYIAERMDAHAKHGWMLKATLKKERS